MPLTFADSHVIIPSQIHLFKYIINITATVLPPYFYLYQIPSLLRKSRYAQYIKFAVCE